VVVALPHSSAHLPPRAAARHTHHTSRRGQCEDIHQHEVMYSELPLPPLGYPAAMLSTERRRETVYGWADLQHQHAMTYMYRYDVNIANPLLVGQELYMYRRLVRTRNHICSLPARWCCQRFEHRIHQRSHHLCVASLRLHRLFRRRWRRRGRHNSRHRVLHEVSHHLRAIPIRFTCTQHSPALRGMGMPSRVRFRLEALRSAWRVICRAADGVWVRCSTPPSRNAEFFEHLSLRTHKFQQRARSGPWRVTPKPLQAGCDPLSLFSFSFAPAAEQHPPTHAPCGPSSSRR
jgi:hypothetical protein